MRLDGGLLFRGRLRERLGADEAEETDEGRLCPSRRDVPFPSVIHRFGLRRDAPRSYLVLSSQHVVTYTRAL